MDQSVIPPFNYVKRCISKNQSFVLQGGAGSGKTETLKRTVQFCLDNHPEKRIVCITHTNKAVDEIISRVGSMHDVSTIHSFLNNLIKSYKKNILLVLPEIFLIPVFDRIPLEGYSGDIKKQKKEEYTRFKKTHEKLAKMRFTALSEETEKVVGKVVYDKDFEACNINLNIQIEELNLHISETLGKHHPSDVKYNETPFDSFHDATFGHDGLIEITSILFKKYPYLGKIVTDRYDCIFVDEYQDTDEKIIRNFIYDTPDVSTMTIGLFGDSEQAIYEDGIGSAKNIIDDGKLVLIEKDDNFRCSPQVIKVANKFRTDGLEQEVALKEVDGKLESKSDREGSAKLLYSLKPSKPKKPTLPKKNAFDDEIRKYHSDLAAYESALIVYESEINRRLEGLINRAQKEIGNHILLKLPNKSIARDANYGSLYDIFDARFRDTRETIKKHLDRLQFGQLSETLLLFESSENDRKSLNRLILKLKSFGFIIEKRSDKENLRNILKKLLNSDKSATEVMDDAISSGIISASETRQAYLHYKDVELERIANEPHLIFFKELQQERCNTKLQMIKYLSDNNTPHISKQIIDEEFDDRTKDIKIENFYNELFSKELSFKEILAFYKYENDDSNFMTMHKTKGSGIENVVVVIDEFKWYKYDFSSCFLNNSSNLERQTLSRRLLYVACSRAKKNLICIRLVSDMEEVGMMNEYFSNCEEVIF